MGEKDILLKIKCHISSLDNHSFLGVGSPLRSQIDPWSTEAGVFGGRVWGVGLTADTALQGAARHCHLVLPHLLNLALLK